MAVYDLGISMESFWDLTPAMFQALCKRRNIRIKYERYAHALTASSVYNANRHSKDAPIITAMDFIRSEESAKRLEKMRAARRDIRKVIMNQRRGMTRPEYLDVRKRVISDLSSRGYDNAEALFNEVWPNLKPTADEEGIENV
jgi:hypothetical protein